MAAGVFPDLYRGLPQKIYWAMAGVTVAGIAASISVITPIADIPTADRSLEIETALDRVLKAGASRLPAD